jgi:protein-tyrosine phosphatase
MTPFWVEISGRKRVALVPRPRGGDWLEDELLAIRAAGVDVLVSMLPAYEQAELGLTQEAALSKQVGLDFRSFPITDRETPESTAAFRAFVAQLRDELHAGKTVAAHCRASIGRSSVLLASLLCQEGLTAGDAFRRLSDARGIEVPDTAEQVRWVESYAKT